MSMPDLHLTFSHTYRNIKYLDSFYRASDRICDISYYYPTNEEDLEIRCFRDITALPRVVEEMIHLCLPDPKAVLVEVEHDDDDGVWKKCLYDLLMDNDNTKE